ncbi:lactonase family protein [Salinibius halmophilus]|uniref:lactonase family protein n=1 Tax=Salinibius halmophilus TaxID=1853216 RepID=UPI001314D0FE|nr:beta-propeller fold lactonase family protein [Salinibius halmophilus]
MTKFWVGGYGEDHPLSLVAIEDEKLVIKRSVAAVNPSFIAQAGSELLLVNEQFPDNGEIWKLDAITHQVLFKRNSLGSAPCHLLVQGKDLYISHYGGGNIMRWDVERLNLQAVFQQRGQGKHHERQASSHVHSTILTPDHQWLLAADLGTDEILMLSPEKLVLEKRFATKAGDGPRHMAWLDPQHLLVTNELSASLSLYLWLDRKLTLVDNIKVGTPLQDYPAEVSVVDGHIYLSIRGSDQLLQLVLMNGRLKRVATVATAGKFPRHFLVTQQYVLVANQLSDRLALFERKSETGEVGALLSTLTVPAPTVVVAVK